MASHHPTERDPVTADTVGVEPVGLLYIGDVRALQLAVTVTFGTHDDGSSWIDAGLSTPPAGEPRIYSAKEQRLFPEADALDRRRRIPVAADICGFDDEQRWHERHLPGARALTELGGARFDEVWRSVAAFLRVGDVVRLQWRADNAVDRLTDPGLYRDELSIAVQRGHRRSTFLLDVQIRPQAARMILADGRPIPHRTERP